MTHAEIVAAIVARGGKLVASFALDAHGRTVGARCVENRPHHCGACGALGHTVARCRGPGMEPRPTHAEQRRGKRVVNTGPLDAAKAELQRRMKARSK